jgi:hypothetical protein
MMRIAHLLHICLLSLIFVTPAGAEGIDIAGNIGAHYAAASPAEKITLIATAMADQVFKSKDRRACQAEVDGIYLAEVKKGASSAEKLTILGTLRKATSDAAKALSKTRRKEKKRSLSTMEPNTAFQAAVAMSYVADTAGGSASLTLLGCLKTVRENTSWIGHSALTLALVSEALWRDAGFLKADHTGKLDMIKALTEDKQMLSSQEQKYLNNAVISDWISGKLKGGATPQAILAEVSDLNKRKKICFFTHSWAKGLLEKIADVR